MAIYRKSLRCGVLQHALCAGGRIRCRRGRHIGRSIDRRSRPRGLQIFGHVQRRMSNRISTLRLGPQCGGRRWRRFQFRKRGQTEGYRSGPDIAGCWRTPGTWIAHGRRLRARSIGVAPFSVLRPAGAGACQDTIRHGRSTGGLNAYPWGGLEFWSRHDVRAESIVIIITPDWFQVRWPTWSR